MVSDDMEVELMAKLTRLMVAAAAVSLVAPGWAQDTSKSSPARIVTKTLVASEAQKECLSLNNRQRLHYKFRADGAWMNRWVMSYLALALQREGFAVQTLSYRTMRGTLAEHLARVAERIAALEAPRLHLVGHSLGGVIVLRYLQRGGDPRVRRAVLLGSPVAGCRAAADLAQSAGGELLLGGSLGVWRE